MFKSFIDFTKFNNLKLPLKMAANMLVCSFIKCY